MGWLLFFSILGVNSLFYSVLVAFFQRPDRFPHRHPRLCDFLSNALYILSFPGFIAYLDAARNQSKFVYRAHMEDMEKAMKLGSYQSVPSKSDISHYGWYVDSYIDESGDFDLEKWKEAEYCSLGLTYYPEPKHKYHCSDFWDGYERGYKDALDKAQETDS